MPSMSLRDRGRALSLALLLSLLPVGAGGAGSTHPVAALAGQSADTLSEPNVGSSGEADANLPPLRPLRVQEVSLYVADSVRAEILAETWNAAADTLRTLPGYADWRARISEKYPSRRSVRLFYDSPEIIRGVTRLPFEDLVTWATLRHKALKGLVDREREDRQMRYARCRYAARQIGGPRGWGRTLSLSYDRLSPEEVRQLAGLQIRGLVAELGTTNPLPPITAGDLYDAVLEWRDKEPHGVGSARPRLTGVVRAVGELRYEVGPSQPYDPEPYSHQNRAHHSGICLLGQALYAHLSDLPEQHARTLLRWLYDTSIDIVDEPTDEYVP